MTGAGDRATVLIVDDHELLSCALVIALGSRGLCAQQLTPQELLDRLDQPAPPGGLVLLDLDLGADIDGARLVGPLRRAGWRVLVITGTRDQAHIAAAVAAGAVGWVPKTAPFDDLVAHAVRGRRLPGRRSPGRGDRREVHCFGGYGTDPDPLGVGQAGGLLAARGGSAGAAAQR